MEYLQYKRKNGIQHKKSKWSFKPCYKWNTFNTTSCSRDNVNALCFKPCYKWNTFNTVHMNRINASFDEVLNLVINGIPSILLEKEILKKNQICLSFKPCYKWNTFNTSSSGSFSWAIIISFKPCYKWNTFNTVNWLITVL